MGEAVMLCFWLPFGLRSIRQFVVFEGHSEQLELLPFINPPTIGHCRGGGSAVAPYS
jgi:hypothetical protein